MTNRTAVMLTPLITVSAGTSTILVSRWLAFLAGYRNDPGEMMVAGCIIGCLASLGWLASRVEHW